MQVRAHTAATRRRSQHLPLALARSTHRTIVVSPSRPLKHLSYPGLARRCSTPTPTRRCFPLLRRQLLVVTVVVVAGVDLPTKAMVKRARMPGDGEPSRMSRTRGSASSESRCWVGMVASFGSGRRSIPTALEAGAASATRSTKAAPSWAICAVSDRSTRLVSIGHFHLKSVALRRSPSTRYRRFLMELLVGKVGRRSVAVRLTRALLSSLFFPSLLLTLVPRRLPIPVHSHFPQARTGHPSRPRGTRVSSKLKWSACRQPR